MHRVTTTRGNTSSNNGKPKAVAPILSEADVKFRLAAYGTTSPGAYFKRLRR